jgi:hypothetical protein
MFSDSHPASVALPWRWDASMGAIISFGLQGLLSFLPSSPGKVRKMDAGLARYWFWIASGA